MYLFDDDQDLGFVDLDSFSPRNTGEALDLLVGESNLFDDYVSDVGPCKAPEKPQLVAKGYSNAREQAKMIYELGAKAGLSRNEIIEQYIKQMGIAKNTAMTYFYFCKNGTY